MSQQCHSTLCVFKSLSMVHLPDRDLAPAFRHVRGLSYLRAPAEQLKPYLTHLGDLIRVGVLEHARLLGTAPVPEQHSAIPAGRHQVPRHVEAVQRAPGALEPAGGKLPLTESTDRIACRPPGLLP